MTDIDRIKVAYKKLKANLYFDKTQLPLRDRVVLFEQEDIDDKLNELKQALIDGKDWEQYEQQILEQIDVLLYPSTLYLIMFIVFFMSVVFPLEFSFAYFEVQFPFLMHYL